MKRGTGAAAARFAAQEDPPVTTADPYDCQTCGACCVSSNGDGGGYVWLAGEEEGRMRRLGLPVVGRGLGALLGTVPHDGRGGSRACAAFAGEVGGPCSCASTQAAHGVAGTSSRG